MKNLKTILLSVALVTFICFVGSCDGEAKTDSGNLSCPFETSALTDANTTSETYDECIVPEDYVGWVSGWYFGRST
ncbi:MAG: hypothetical protein GY762_21910 [Proteobacteria bacterium]|nr:hypothetical protein [Pseudomonadota bacterium]